MPEHLLFRFPPDAGIAIVNTVLSGAVPAGYPNGPFTPGVLWHGRPSRLTPHQSWIAIAYRGEIHGWLRYCCDRYEAIAHVGIPPQLTPGHYLYPSRVWIPPILIPVPSGASRSHYLTPTEIAAITAHYPIPGPLAGIPCPWGNAGQVGCSHNGGYPGTP